MVPSAEMRRGCSRLRSRSVLVAVPATILSGRGQLVRMERKVRFNALLVTPYDGGLI